MQVKKLTPAVANTKPGAPKLKASWLPHGLGPPTKSQSNNMFKPIPTDDNLNGIAPSPRA